MKQVECLKDEVKRLIGAPSLIQRDREGRALFFSDFYARGIEGAKERLMKAGFTVERARNHALIDLSDQRYRQLFASLPVHPLPERTETNVLLLAACDMLRRHPSPLNDQPLLPLKQGLLLADRGNLEELARYMQHALADALRDKTPVPSALASLMLDCLKEEISC